MIWWTWKEGLSHTRKRSSARKAWIWTASCNPGSLMTNSIFLSPTFCNSSVATWCTRRLTKRWSILYGATSLLLFSFRLTIEAQLVWLCICPGVQGLSIKEGIHMVIHAVEFIMGEMEVAYKCLYYKRGTLQVWHMWRNCYRCWSSCGRLGEDWSGWKWRGLCWQFICRWLNSCIFVFAGYIYTMWTIL